MKLYIEDGEIYLDYSDVDFEDRMAGDHDYRYFTHEYTSCGWERTLKPRVKHACIREKTYRGELGDMMLSKFYANEIYHSSSYFNSIEIVNESEFKALISKLEEECERLALIEQEKKRKEEAEKHWNSLRKNGCGSCKNKRRDGDDFVCAASGDYLPEENCPGNRCGVYMLFNYQPFPTDNCPFNINKTEEAI